MKYKKIRSAKTFWNKIKLQKGKNTIHTNDTKDEEGNKFHSNK